MTIAVRHKGIHAIVAVALIAAGALAGCSLTSPPSASRATLKISAQPALYPAFAPNVSDYVVRCADRPLQLSVSSPPGTRIAVDGAQPRAGRFTLGLTLTTGRAFRITAYHQRGDATTYYVRCLPSDFPAFTVHRGGATEASYYIVTPSLALNLSKASSPYLAIFDNNGTPLWWMRSGPLPVDAQLLPTGHLVWSHYPFGRTAEHNLDGKLIRTYPAPGGPPDTHEIQVLPNGNYLVAVDVWRSANLTPCGRRTEGQIYDPVIEELRPNGSVSWSWDTFAHIPLSEVDPNWHGLCVGGDPYHFNAIAPDTNAFSLANDKAPIGHDVLVSYRHLDAVYDIDMTTGRIAWKLGGTIRPDDTNLTVLHDPAFDEGGGFGGQHDVRLLPDGTLTVYDNSVLRRRTPRAARYSIDPLGRTATLLEQVSTPGVKYALYSGSANKLPGGNWVLSDGANPVVSELTPSGSPVYTLRFGKGLFSYRADPVLPDPPGRGLVRSALRAGMDAQYPR